LGYFLASLVSFLASFLGGSTGGSSVFCGDVGYLTFLVYLSAKSFRVKALSFLKKD
jgi:hypothetical protein